MRYLFEFKEDRDTGELGWIAVGAAPEFNPGDGGLVAHDILEHKDNNYTGWADELIALGAMIYIRGETGYFYSMYNPNWWYHLSGDLVNCFLFLKDNRIHTTKANRIPHIEGDLDRAIQEGAKNAGAECGGSAVPAKHRDLVKHWLRKGYRMARKRYRSQNAAACLFNTIQQEVDRATKWADTGSRLEVRVCIRQRDVRVSLLDCEDEY